MRLEEVLALIDEQIAKLKMVAREAEAAVEVLKSLKNSDEVMTPIGGGVLVHVRWQGKILMDVGGGILLEVPLDKAVEKLERRAERAKNEIKRLMEEKRKIIETARGKNEPPE